MKRMDKLDKMTIAGVIALVLYAAGLLLLTYDPSHTEAEEKRAQAARHYTITPELQNKIRVAKTLLIQDNLEKSETLLQSLLKEYPYEGQLYMLQGDILMRRQKPVAAMYQYKEAISLNPDFLDKKTELFQGKKIKVTVEEALAAIESALQETPSNSQLKTDRETVYFMKRKLAGSCG